MTFNTTKPNQIKENSGQRDPKFYDFTVENLINNSNEIEGLTSFLEFQSKIHNKSKALKFHYGTINAIVARQGEGKSTLMFNLAIDFISKGKKVLFLTLEETDKQVSNKMLALMAYKLGYKLPPSDNFDRMVGHIQYQAKASKSGQFDGLPSLIDQSIKDLQEGLRLAFMDPSLPEIKELIKKAYKQDPFDIVFIDYFQLLRGDTSPNSWDSSLVNADELKGLAIELGTIIVTGSQANRASVQSKEAKTGTEVISGGDGLSNVCNVILHISKDKEKNGVSKIEIAKDRDSQLGTKPTVQVKVIDNQILIPIPGTGGELIKPRK